MAFDRVNLSVIAYANGFTLWHYSGKDETLEVLLSAGFFNPMKDVAVNPGDIIIINSSNGTCIRMLDVIDGVVTVRLLSD